MNLVQWKGQKTYIPKVIYMHGRNCTMVRLALEHLEARLQPSDVIHIDLSVDREVAVWLSLSQFPLEAGTANLIVVRSAEKLKDWDYLTLWLTEGSSSNYICFISEQESLNSEDAHVAIIKKKGKVVECNDLSDEGLLTLTQETGIDRKTAELIVERTSGDLKSILNILEKAKAIGGMNGKALAALCNDLALDDFSDYLVFGDKTSALRSLDGLSRDLILRQLAILFDRLQFLQELNECALNRMPQMDIVSKLRVKIFLVKKYSSVAKNFSEKTVMRRRLLVSMTESAVRNGSRGAMESLVALW